MENLGITLAKQTEERVNCESSERRAHLKCLEQRLQSVQTQSETALQNYTPLEVHQNIHNSLHQKVESERQARQSFSETERQSRSLELEKLALTLGKQIEESVKSESNDRQ